MNEWRLIETAPKDGNAILLYGTPESSPYSRPHIGCEGVHVGYWSDCGWQHWWLDSWIVEPTHWMPLPEPPVEHRSKSSAA